MSVFKIVASWLHKTFVNPIQSQDKSKLLSGWNAFKSHFRNPTIQDNIRSSKEEQYQGEFLIDLFVNFL
jgi:hypothetical protein